ncbi:hypothetical protein [Erythrobacter donghaensis]|uniref:hypothetical protein n=1 Tax=Erythrobacter donghaensis TaxID=267135 RepID=UPI0013026066|nr:hypothetical protein [Erythrobacter donghaensis]
MLASCGGGDSGGSPPPTGGGGGGGGGGGTPTPSPSPSPSPTPTYQTFSQLTGTQTFATTCGGTATESPPPRAIGGMPLGQGLRIVSDRSQPAYEISSNGNIVGTFTSTFTQADRDTTRTGEAYVKVLPSGFTERLSIITLNQGGNELEYVRVAQIIAQPFVGSTNLLCAFGVPTIVTDRPPATVTYGGLAYFGTATVTLDFGSGASTNYVVSSSVITMTANPANGQVNFSLDLKGREISSSGTSTTVTDLGVFTGTATLDGTTPSFTDILVNSTNVVSGTFGGGFFGPQGRTSAVSVSIQTRRADNSDLRLGGLFILRPST